MKLRVLAVALILLGLAGGYGLAVVICPDRHFGENCPGCDRKGNLVDASKDKTGQFWMLSSRPKSTFNTSIARVPSTEIKPDCFCYFCNRAWNSHELKLHSRYR